VAKGAYDKQIGVTGETSSCLAELWKLWRNCLSFHRFCMQAIESDQCHGGSGTWGDLRALFVGTPQTSDHCCADILRLPRCGSSVTRCNGDLIDCPCREFSGSLCTAEFQWDLQDHQQDQNKVGSQDPFVMGAQNRSRSTEALGRQPCLCSAFP
jgi:hypothetical protein